MANYDIWVDRVLTEADYGPYGVEIQPPLTELAAQGLCSVLTYRPSVEESESSPLAEAVYVTRNDETGTALVVYPRARKTGNFQRPSFGIGSLAAYVRSYLNPSYQSEVEVELHFPHSNEDKS